MLHRFDIQPGSWAKLDEWIAFLPANRAAAVKTLEREETYFEAMFASPDEPRRLYWITIQGPGGAPVDSSTLDLDRRHLKHMADLPRHDRKAGKLPDRRRGRTITPDIFNPSLS